MNVPGFLPTLPRLSSGFKSVTAANLWGLTLRGLSLGGVTIGGERVSCAIDSCGESFVLPNVKAWGSAETGARRGEREAGIRVGENWYCSTPCFAAAVETRLLDLLLQRASRSNTDRMPLNLLLMARGWLTQSQSIDAANEQKRTGEGLDEVLVRLGVVTEQQITVVRATQAGYPVYSLHDSEGQPRHGAGGLAGSGQGHKIASVGISIPRILIELHAMLPLHYSPATRRLLVGFVHGVEHGLLYTIEQMTLCRAEPCFLTPADFRERLGRPESRPANDEVRFEEPGRPVEMARTVCKYALEMEADEARFGRTRNYLWARLRSRSHEVDLLFRLPHAGRARQTAASEAGVISESPSKEHLNIRIF